MSSLGKFAVRALSSVVWVLLSRKTFPVVPASSCAVRNMAYTTLESGAAHTADYRVYFNGGTGLISPFHDIPLFADKEKNIYNMIVEIPRWSNAKMEISTKEKLNPIKQDVKKGKMRFVSNVFPYKGYIWNYGAIPQTWEDPTEIDEHTKHKGDNDPIDALEIGHKVAKRGEVKQVKILGTYALIDEGETDWKILTIDVNDPLAEKLNDIDDIKKHMPGLLEATHEWFRLYKVPTGKPENEFAFNGQPKNREFATNIVGETHKYWQRLIKKEKENSENLACENVSVDGSPYKISDEDAKNIGAQLAPSKEPESVPMEVDTWHYLEQSKIFTMATTSDDVCKAK